MKIKPVLSARQLTPLLEILIVTVFFAGASVVLAQLFAKAHRDSNLAHDINGATLFVGECAERLRASEYSSDLAESALPGFERGGDGVYRVYVDGGFAPAPKGGAYAEVRFEGGAEETGAGWLLTGRFVCTRSDGEELVMIDAARYYPFESP